MAKDRRVPDNHVYLAQALFDSDRKQAAENVYRNAARQFAKSEFVQFAAGEYYFNEKNYATAVRYLSAAVALKKDSARSQLGLALSLFESDKPAEALVHFGEACKLDKTRAAYNELRSASARLRKVEQMKIASQYDSKVVNCQ
jgi:tetratricopeptide (TPR) repeat protein